MGNLIQTPKDESVVLIPPRFSVRGLTRSIEIESPISLYFGNLFRREVLYDLHSFHGTLGLDILMAPESPPSTAAHVSLGGSIPSRTIGSGSLNLHLNKELSDTWRAIGRLSLGTTNGITGFAMVSTTSRGGKVSMTSSVENSEPQNVGIRLQSEYLLIGTDVPISNPFNVSAWGIARISDELWLGLSGSPLDGRSPFRILGSYEKRIPGTDSSYCVSSSLNMPTKEVSIGFSQHLVTHRKVYNVFEDKRVKFIANYIDIAVEASSKPDDSKATQVAAGISWQPNKNMLLKLHASTQQGLVGTWAVRNYWVPSVLVAVSGGVDTKGSLFLGGRLQVSNWLSSAEYQRGQPISALPVTKWLNTEDLDRFSPSNRYL